MIKCANSLSENNLEIELTDMYQTVNDKCFKLNDTNFKQGKVNWVKVTLINSINRNVKVVDEFSGLKLFDYNTLSKSFNQYKANGLSTSAIRKKLKESAPKETHRYIDKKVNWWCINFPWIFNSSRYNNLSKYFTIDNESIEYDVKYIVKVVYRVDGKENCSEPLGITWLAKENVLVDYDKVEYEEYFNKIQVKIYAGSYLHLPNFKYDPCEFISCVMKIINVEDPSEIITLEQIYNEITAFNTERIKNTISEWINCKESDNKNHNDHLYDINQKQNNNASCLCNFINNSIYIEEIDGKECEIFECDNSKKYRTDKHTFLWFNNEKLNANKNYKATLSFKYEWIEYQSEEFYIKKPEINSRYKTRS